MKGEAVRPQFVDAYSNGDFQLFMDGELVTTVNFQVQYDTKGNPILGPGPRGSEVSSLNGFSILAYDYEVTAKGIEASIEVTALTNVSHTFGMVQRNGACIPESATDSYGRDLRCLGAPDSANGQLGINGGYVLAEGRTTFTLKEVSNTPIALTLQGVLESAHLCAAACDGKAGDPDASGVYHITAYPTDENGNAVQGKLAYANGWWDIQELGNQNLVTITKQNPGPYNFPNTDKSGWDAQPFTFTCNAPGDTVIAARLLQTNPTGGLVDGFPYSKANYPEPGDYIGPVGADLHFGNMLDVHCAAPGNVALNVN